MRILTRSKPPMRKGLKTVTKEEMNEGSKLLMLATLPVPKKAEQKQVIQITIYNYLDKKIVTTHRAQKLTQHNEEYEKESSSHIFGLEGANQPVPFQIKNRVGHGPMNGYLKQRRLG